jgi:hypothetical protein
MTSPEQRRSRGNVPVQRMAHLVQAASLCTFLLISCGDDKRGEAPGFGCDFDGRCPAPFACEATSWTCQPSAASCEAPRDLCADECVDLQSDALHCGGCNAACQPGKTCAAGRCIPGGNMTCLFCAPGVTCINGSCDCQGRGALCSALCIDTQQLPVSCGGCFTACMTSGAICRGGSCQCPVGEKACGGDCLDVRTDPVNCGDCGVICGAGQRCEAGQCVTSCSTAQNCATDRCYDVDNDSRHCGSTCSPCPTGAACVAGNCECPQGTQLCGAACIDVLRDSNHCGACDQACATGERCVAGACQCQTGLNRCGATCTSLSDDGDHCGDCNQPCAPGTLCSNGQCVTSCSLGVEPCAEMRSCPSGLNPSRCGSCSRTCSPGEVCVDAQCSAETPAVGCSTCPCPTCDDVLCCLRDGKPYCVDAFRCPP